jgi:hypothetical protein
MACDAVQVWSYKISAFTQADIDISEQLTSCSEANFNKLIAALSLKKFLVLKGTRNFITLFTTTPLPHPQWPLS